MCLPLHQFLRVKREAKAAAEAAAAAKGEGGKDSVPPVLIGETDPAEFLDPFLGTLMREPVLLESSGQKSPPRREATQPVGSSTRASVRAVSRTTPTMP
jgi:hypothetical protein